MDVRLKRYEVRTQGVMLLLSLVFLAVYALPIIKPGLPTAVVDACMTANYAIWTAFIADYLIRVALAERHWQFVRTHLVDLVIVALPILRPLRALRVFTVSEALFLRSAGQIYLRAAQVIIGATGLVVFIGATAMLDAERNAPGSRITTFGEALWWAITTITTVGYGDTYPVTGTGRVIAAAMMMLGITMLGLVTATVAAWFVRLSQRLERKVEPSHDAAELRARLAEIEATLTQLHDDINHPATRQQRGRSLVSRPGSS